MKCKKRTLLQWRWLLLLTCKAKTKLELLSKRFSRSSPSLRTEKEDLVFKILILFAMNTLYWTITLYPNCKSVIYHVDCGMNESSRPVEMSQIMHKYPQFSSDKIKRGGDLYSHRLRLLSIFWLIWLHSVALTYHSNSRKILWASDNKLSKRWFFYFFVDSAQSRILLYSVCVTMSQAWHLDFFSSIIGLFRSWKQHIF